MKTMDLEKKGYMQEEGDMKMKKSTGFISLVAILALTAGLIYTAIFGLGQNKSGSASSIDLGLDLAGGVSITYEVVGDENPNQTDMDDTIYKLTKRVEAYSTEAQAYQEGSNRITIEIPGVSDANEVLKEIGTPGKLYFIEETNSNNEANYYVAFDVDDDGNMTNYGYRLDKPIEEIEASGSILLTGTDVESAKAGTMADEFGNSQNVVELSMTAEGTKKFADATKKAYEKGETLAIYYDGELISVPYVNTPIEDGKAIISGMESFEEADILATQIRIGGLSLELQEVRSQVVGAQLGAEAIESSLLAGAIGLALVIIFMIVVYFVPGVAASIALFIYTTLMVVMLDSFSITLTLSGIAGIILSIGMAVDANVIIFARIREELATGKTVQSSIKQGFNKALSAILDGNITTLIAAAVLGFMGTGSVKGFAQTLALGIVLSMFTALIITRVILAVFYAIGFQDEKFYGVAKERKPLQILQKKKIWFSISGVLVASGIIAMIIFNLNGKDELNYSLEFKGGTSTTVEFNETYELKDIEEKVLPKITEVIGDNEVQVTMVKDSNAVVFKTKTLDEDARLSLDNMFEAEFGVIPSESESISGTVSGEMRKDAIVAIGVATLLMLIYIAFRFSDFRFGASSIIALLHDVLVVLAFYAIARISVGNNFIACMLTIVGYSINATIVIFDRIRENLKEMKRDSLEDIVNKSITQSLGRSIFTSLTTFFMVAALCIFGASSLVEFALPLMVGIVCGTFSSICLTGPIWYLLRKKFAVKESDD